MFVRHLPMAIEGRVELCTGPIPQPAVGAGAMAHANPLMIAGMVIPQHDTAHDPRQRSAGREFPPPVPTSFLSTTT